MGTPYLWGGDDRQGIDCSAFVQNVYADALNVALPRTTLHQGDVGDPVAKEGLAIADLVFFQTPKRHVGIYVGDGRFAHASTSRGVMISRLDEPFWRNAYTSARRPHDLASAESRPVGLRPVEQVTTGEARLEQKPPKPTRRTGW